MPINPNDMRIKAAINSIGCGGLGLKLRINVNDFDEIFADINWLSYIEN